MNFFVKTSEVNYRPNDKNYVIRKMHFKKYSCFDGCGNMYFSTKIDAMSYVVERSKQIQKGLDFCLSSYPTISKYYIDTLPVYGVYSDKSNLVNEYLKDMLSVIKYLTSAQCKYEYVLPKTIYLLNRYKEVTHMLKYLLLDKLVEKKLKELVVEYPVYRSDVYKQILHDKKFKKLIESQEVKNKEYVINVG